jgi:hypothetical protein
MALCIGHRSGHLNALRDFVQRQDDFGGGRRGRQPDRLVGDLAELANETHRGCAVQPIANGILETGIGNQLKRAFLSLVSVGPPS